MTDDNTDDNDLRGPIRAAEIAASDEDLETTENALLEALGRVRRARNVRTDGGKP